MLAAHDRVTLTPTQEAVAGVSNLNALRPKTTTEPCKAFKTCQPGFLHVDVKHLTTRWPTRPPVVICSWWLRCPNRLIAGRPLSPDRLIP